MKKNVRLLFIFLIITTFSFSCDSSSDSTDEKTGNNELVDCVVGEWNYKSDMENLTFVFNDDYTGTEDIGDGEGPRNFSWTLKDESTIVIVYINETQKWELGINCEKVQLTVWGLIYQKINQ